MGIITRTPYVSGNDVTAEGQNANEQAVLDQVNGNLEDVNIKTTAGIVGTKIADAPNGIPTQKINDKAVTDTKLANDATNDALRAVKADSIKNTVIIARHVKTAIYAWSPGGNILNNSVVVNDTGLTTTIVPLALYMEGTNVLMFVNPTLAQIKMSLHWNLDNSHWFIAIHNQAGGTLNMTGVAFKLLYIPVS